MPELAEWETFCLIVGSTAGVVYTGVVVRRMRRQRAYRPEFEDWVFHAALLLLFIGIHNAWDAIAYHVFLSLQR